MTGTAAAIRSATGWHEGRAVAPGMMLAGKLRVLRSLGEGNRSEVFAVWNEEDWAAMACKLVRPPWHADRRTLEGLVREGELLAAMAHPNIVRVFEVNYAAEPVSILMELLDGPDLKSALAQRGRFTVAAAAQVAAEAGSALAHLHRQGYLHLDVKPRNILLHRGSAKLVDLGISRMVGQRPAEGPGSGTTPYMAPEQITGGRPLTPATDVFALGVVLFELLTGERPFPRPLARRHAEAALSDRFPQLALRPRRLRELRPRAPGALDVLLADCLEINPLDRPASMPDVLAALQPFVRNQQELHGWQTAPARLSPFRHSANEPA